MRDRTDRLARELMSTPLGGVLVRVVGVMNQYRGATYEEALRMTRETVEEVAVAQANAPTTGLSYLALRTHCYPCLIRED